MFKALDLSSDLRFIVQIQCKGCGLEITIKINWNTTQEVSSKFLVCSVGKVKCGDLRKSTRSCSLPPQTHPAKDAHEKPYSPLQSWACRRKASLLPQDQEICALESRALQKTPKGKPWTMTPV